VYLLATAATLLVGFCVSRFAAPLRFAGFALHLRREHPAAFLRRNGCLGLLLAYLATGASVAGGALYYTNLFALEFFHRRRPRCPHWLLSVGVAGIVVWRDVKLSPK